MTTLGNLRSSSYSPAPRQSQRFEKAPAQKQKILQRMCFGLFYSPG